MNPICSECLLIEMCDKICTKAHQIFKVFIRRINQKEDIPTSNCPGCGEVVSESFTCLELPRQTTRYTMHEFHCGRCFYWLKYVKNLYPSIREASFRREYFGPDMLDHSYYYRNVR